MATVLRDFHEEVRTAGVDFHVVILPDRFQVNVPERDAALTLLRMRSDQFDWDLPQRELRTFLAGDGISHLDLLPVFRDITRSEQMFDPGNTHWNVRGNEFVGNEIARWLGPRLPAER